MTLLHMPPRPICKKHGTMKRVTRSGRIYCTTCSKESNSKSHQRRKAMRAELRPYVKQLLENFGRIA